MPLSRGQKIEREISEQAMDPTQTFLRNILKAQNERLLEEIAAKFGLDPNVLKQKYLTPTFYSVEIKKMS